MVGTPDVGTSLDSRSSVVDTELDGSDDAEANTTVEVTTPAIVEINVVEVTLSAETDDTTFFTSSLLLSEGKNRVHQKAIRTLRSNKRSLRTSATIRKKKTRPAMIRMRSSQSVFSSATTSCLEVVMTEVKVSC